MHSVEAARAVAAIAVVLMHCSHLMRVEHFSGHIGLGGIFEVGYFGVDFFFVLSGFIITYVHYADIGTPSSIPRYLWRRLTRIYPIYWICLFAAVAILAAGRIALGKPIGIPLTIDDLLNTVFLIRTLDEHPKYVGVAWTLQYEVMFYLSFCALLLHRQLGFLFLAVWLALVVANIATGGTDAFFTSAHCAQFIMGIGIALLTRSRNFPEVRLGTLYVALSLLATAILYESIITQRHEWDGRFALGIGSASTLFCLVELEKRGAISTPAWLYRTGSVSYSIYLSHIVIINVIFAVLLKLGLYHRLPELAIFVIGFLGAMACAIALGLWIELPMVSFLKDFYDRRWSIPSPRFSESETTST